MSPSQYDGVSDAGSCFDEDCNGGPLDPGQLTPNHSQGGSECEEDHPPGVSEEGVNNEIDMAPQMTEVEMMMTEGGFYTSQPKVGCQNRVFIHY